MRVLVQRVKRSSIFVKSVEVARIAHGFVLFVGVGKGDTPEDAGYLAKKIAQLRIFDDANGKINLNIKDAGGVVLSIPQFTLYAGTARGNRPGFDQAAPPDLGRSLWEELNRLLEREGLSVSRGVFGAAMDIELVNEGPMTIWLDSRDRSS